MEQQAVVVKQRTWVLMAVLAAMFAGYPLLRRSPWLGSTELHTLMELLATTLALFVGCLAFLRFYSKKNNTFLFIAGGFVGTGLLDAYHMVQTSHWFDQLWPSPPPSLIPWSWNASRYFLSILMLTSWWAWRRETRLGKEGHIPEKTVYLGIGLFTVFSFGFFAFYPLHAPTIRRSSSDGQRSCCQHSSSWPRSPGTFGRAHGDTTTLSSGSYSHSLLAA